MDGQIRFMVDWDPVKSPTPGHQGYTGLASKIGINTDDVMTLHDAYLGQDSQASTECVQAIVTHGATLL